MDAALIDTALAGTERRRGMPPVPTDLNAQLTELQRLALNRIGGFGWRLAFVRRPTGAAPTVVVRSPDGATHAILSEEGDIDRSAALTLRAQAGA